MNHKWSMIFICGVFLAGLSFASEIESGGDVPFFRFSCLFSPVFKDVPFTVTFKNDDIKERFHWESPLGRSRVIFEKIDKRSALVSIQTLPGIGIIPTTVVPEEFKFISPITTESIHFSTTLKPVGEVRSNSLSCVRLKIESEEAEE